MFCVFQANRGESETSANRELRARGGAFSDFSCFACTLVHRAGLANPPVLQARSVKTARNNRKGRVGRVKLARFTREDHAYSAARLPNGEEKTTVFQSTN